VIEIGFVVRTRDESDYVGFALQSIFDHFGNDVPVCIVDNESQDDTLTVVDMFPKRFHRIDVLRVEKGSYTPGKSLNIGIESLAQMGCATVGILSAHCEMQTASLRVVREKLQDSSVFAVMGRQIPIRRGKRITPRYIWSNFVVDNDVINPHETPTPTERRPFFHNAFSFLRVHHWKERKFDEDLAGKEDRYWAQDQISLGRKFVLTPDLVCRHFWTPKGATWAD
jgi:hypothetical protein